jgi:hypothetical protein
MEIAVTDILLALIAISLFAVAWALLAIRNTLLWQLSNLQAEQKRIADALTMLNTNFAATGDSLNEWMEEQRDRLKAVK